MKQQKLKPSRAPVPAVRELSQQYGGHHSGSWVSLLPSSVIPYIQLSRLSPPAGLFLIFFPHFFGVLLSAIRFSHLSSSVEESPSGSSSSSYPAATPSTLSTLAVLFLGSFFFSNAAHAWNDLVDSPLDALVERTKSRPIPRGAISAIGALVFTLSQGIGAALVLWLFLPSGAAGYALVNILATVYYPWAKRHTNFAQVVLGFCLAWGVFMGMVGMGMEPFVVQFKGWNVPGLGLGLGSPAQDMKGTSGTFGLDIYDMHVHIDIAAMGLFLACVLWTVIYDTIYAHQDVSDDVKLGLKSTAVLFRSWTKPVLWVLLVTMLGLLGLCGAVVGMSWLYFVICLSGCALSLGAMILHVDLKDTASCWWWFRYGFWLAGSSMAGGLGAEYAVRLWL